MHLILIIFLFKSKNLRTFYETKKKRKIKKIPKMNNNSSLIFKNRRKKKIKVGQKLIGSLVFFKYDMMYDVE